MMPRSALSNSPLIRCFGLLLVACVAVACNPDTDPIAVEPASIVFFGDNIIAVDPLHSGGDAVAVRGENIVAVGSKDEVQSLVGEETRIVELGDHALLPGFIDSHGHLALVARLLEFVNLSSPPVGPVRDIDDIIRLLAERIEAGMLPPGEWLYAYGYDDSLIAENRHPTRDDLDRVSVEHPIVLMHVSGHLAAVNSAALAAKRLDATTDDPPGGVIRRRNGGREPNGVLEETAIYPFVFEHFQKTPPAELESQLRDAIACYASFGITTIQEGAASLSDVAVFESAASVQPFAVDVVAYPIANPLDDAALDAVQVEDDYTGGFRVGGIKFSLDGSPQGRTAFLSAPYTEGPPGTDSGYRAYPTYAATEFNPRIARLLRDGKQVLVHANGDAAIDLLIDGVAQATANGGLSDHRTVIVHAQLTREDQLPRIKALGLVPSYFAAHPFFWGDWHRRSFGEQRAAFISPLARSAELGIPFTIHNDTPIVPPDMMRLWWIAVNRKTRSGHVLGPEQRATAEQALHALTLGGAYQYFEEDRKGSITPGKQADLVILGTNPLVVDADAIKDIPVLETFARGRSVYRQ